MPSFPSHSCCQSLLSLHIFSAVTACVHIVLFLVTSHESHFFSRTNSENSIQQQHVLSTAMKDRETGILFKGGSKINKCAFLLKRTHNKMNHNVPVRLSGSLQSVLCSAVASTLFEIIHFKTVLNACNYSGSQVLLNNVIETTVFKLKCT